MTQLSREVIDKLKVLQTNEITEYVVYTHLANKLKDEHNKNILLKIASDELAHSNIWKSYTKEEIQPKRLTILFYDILNIIFGYTFTLKIMEKVEDKANKYYDEIAEVLPVAKKIADEEEEHEHSLIAMLDEERLQYVGSMVLGLNDALVELTGTIAGLSFALQNTKLVALSGLVTGISATLSMASSEFLSARSDGNANAMKSAFYTGIMYIVAVFLLVLPYLLLPEDAYLPALIIMLVIVLLIIFVFTFYISVAKDLPFKRRFWEMAIISFSVAGFAFIIGLLIKQALSIDI